MSMDATSNGSKIISRIKEDSDLETQEILKNAHKIADDIISSAKNKAKSEETEIIEKAKHDAELTKQRIIANAKLKSKKHCLYIKEGIIQNTFDEAETKLGNFRSSPKYPEILKDIIEEGIESINGEDAEISVKKDDITILTNDFLKDLSNKFNMNLTISKESIRSNGGALIRTIDGKIVVNNTFETRMQRMRDHLRSEVAKILFKR
jgi:V/A-type H+-transporting ATPase subunit E|tara:strand:+ start:205 stop:825 length:621 start_codon:yes stop_codon:yes gene_type:complete